jgi:hypothetical protein
MGQTSYPVHHGKEWLEMGTQSAGLPETRMRSQPSRCLIRAIQNLRDVIPKQIFLLCFILVTIQTLVMMGISPGGAVHSSRPKAEERRGYARDFGYS